MLSGIVPRTVEDPPAPCTCARRSRYSGDAGVTAVFSAVSDFPG